MQEGGGAHARLERAVGQAAGQRGAHGGGVGEHTGAQPRAALGHARAHPVVDVQRRQRLIRRHKRYQVTHMPSNNQDKDSDLPVHNSSRSTA